MFPCRDGCYVRFDDWKVIFGEMGVEIGTKIEIHESDAGTFVPCTWSQRHFINVEKNFGLGVNIPVSW